MRILFLCIVCLTLPLSSAAATDQCTVPAEKDVKKDSTNVPLCLVAKKIAMALDQYNNDSETIANALPQLSKAEFDFKTVSSNTGGLKFSILVFSLGATHKAESTNDVNFSYEVPPPPPEPKGMSYQGYVGFLRSKPKPKDFSKELVETLQSAAQQIKSTDSVKAARFKTLTVSLAYGVTWDFSIGATVPIQLVTIGGSLDHNRADTQTVKLTFQNPAPVRHGLIHPSKQ